MIERGFMRRRSVRRLGWFVIIYAASLVTFFAAVSFLRLVFK